MPKKGGGTNPYLAGMPSAMQAMMQMMMGTTYQTTATLVPYENESFASGADVSLESYGGRGDNSTDNTRAFARAIDAIRLAGRGRLSVGPGIFLSFPFNLTSHMVLFLRANTTITAWGCADEIDANSSCARWPQIPPLPNYGLDHDIGALSRYQSFVHAQDFENITILGEGSSSIIDGAGQSWWRAHLESRLRVGRPHLIEVVRGRNLSIRDCVLKDSPFWTVHPVAVAGVRAHRIRVTTPLKGAPNTDGFDPDACQDVVISDSVIHSNDDCIAIKAGLDCFAHVYGPCERVIIHNVSCVNAIVIGSEMSGGVRNVSISNSSGRLYVKSGQRRGGFITNIYADDVMIVPPNSALGLPPPKYGIRITTSYGSKPTRCGHDWNPAPTYIDDLSFTHIHAGGDIVLQNWSVDVDATHANVTGLHFAHIELPWATSGKGFSCDTSARTVVRGSAFDVVPRVCPQLFLAAELFY